MIAISKAAYNPKVNAVAEKRVRTFPNWNEQIMDYFEYLVSKKKSVYLWGCKNNTVNIIAISKAYTNEYKKVID